MFVVYLVPIVFVMFLWKGIKIIMGYDAWLEQPFQDACAAADEYEEAVESFIESDSYWESYDSFVETNPGVSDDDWQETDDFEQSVTNYWRIRNEPYEPPTGYEARIRGYR